MRRKKIPGASNLFCPPPLKCNFLHTSGTDRALVLSAGAQRNREIEPRPGGRAIAAVVQAASFAARDGRAVHEARAQIDGRTTRSNAQFLSQGRSRGRLQ